MNTGRRCGAFALPCGTLGCQLGLVGQAVIQAWAIPHAHCRLCHRQPTARFGRGMTHERIPEASSLLGRKGLRQARAIGGGQMVLDQTNVLRLRRLRFPQGSDPTRGIPASPPGRDVSMPPATPGLAPQQRMASPLPCRLVVHPRWLAWLGPVRRPHLTTPWLTGCGETDLRRPQIIGQRIRWQHLFQAPDKVGIGMGGDTPRRNDPRASGIFFNACRTGSRLRGALNPRTTSASASSGQGQWQRPWGGALQAKRTKCCSISP